MQKKYRQAIRQYDEAIARKKDLSVAYIYKGQSLEFLDKFQEAIGNYNELLKINPSQNEALTRRGICYMKQSAYLSALDDLEKANQSNPNSSEILCNLGFCKVKLKDTLGFKDLNQAIQLDSSNYMAFYDRGLARYVIKEYSKALNDFEQAVSMRQNFGEAYCGIGLCKNQLGYRDQACRFWKLAARKGYTKVQYLIDSNCR